MTRGAFESGGLATASPDPAAEAGDSQRTFRLQGEALVGLARASTLRNGSLEQALSKMTEVASHTMGAARASVWLFEPDRSVLRLRDLFQIKDGSHSRGIDLKPGDFPSYFRALEAERCIAAHDALTDPRTCEFSEAYLKPLGITSMLDAPVCSDGSVVGVVCLEHVGPARTWSADEQSFVGSLGDLVSLALESSARRRTQDALHETEERFRQAQKMEAIGRLAGGVAHDFNNLLTVILGYSQSALETLDERDPLRKDLQEIELAGGRAAALTRQLLAFSRKQVLQSQVVNLNTIVRGIEKMLHRLIGEDIRLATSLAQDLWSVRADPGQIEQVVLNLTVNARDAMPAGGTLMLETANVELDESFVRQHPGLSAGPYSMLAVSDTGIGMTEEVKSRLFEPFFTTKEPGKGTGLGLSTVYGIVRQSHGHIAAYSEEGRGTVFKVYLPRVSQAARAETRTRKGQEGPRGTETVLLVEDDPSLRTLAQNILLRNGYQVLAAQHGADALILSERHPRRIHLLLTDVVMPQMGGRELSERLQPTRMDLKVLYMSGYTDAAFGDANEVDPRHFIQKPFTPQSLLQKVRLLLDEPDP